MLIPSHEHDCQKQVGADLTEADTHPWSWLPQTGLCSSEADTHPSAWLPQTGLCSFDWGWYSSMSMIATNRSVQLWLMLILTHEHDCHKQVCAALTEADTHPSAWLPQTGLCSSNWGWYSPMAQTSLCSFDWGWYSSMSMIATNRSVQLWLRLILTHQHYCHKQVCAALTEADTRPSAWLPQTGLCSFDWGWYLPMSMIATNRSVQLWLRLILTQSAWLPQTGMCSSNWGWYLAMSMIATNRSVQLWLRLLLIHEHDCHKQVCAALTEADTHPSAWLPQTGLCSSDWGWYSAMSMIATNRSVQL